MINCNLMKVSSRMQEKGLIPVFLWWFGNPQYSQYFSFAIHLVVVFVIVFICCCLIIKQKATLLICWECFNHSLLLLLPLLCHCICLNFPFFILVIAVFLPSVNFDESFLSNWWKIFNNNWNFLPKKIEKDFLRNRKLLTIGS